MQLTLANGLRVVLAADHSRPVVSTAVTYDVGSRSEPVTRTGFAHLFEHLMFQGSQNLAKGEHARLVQSAGGTFNGSTLLDETRYHNVVPPAAVELVLYCEADRMLCPQLTESALRNQVGVVAEEIKSNLRNRPYGGFPRTGLPAVMFSHFASAHDGYGSFEDLDAATVADAEEFFNTYYAPGNAVLCVLGDFDPDDTAELIQRSFAEVPARAVPERPSFEEPFPTTATTHSYVDPLAPLPAFAVGWRVPNPDGSLAEYLPYVVLAEMLGDGELSRLGRRLLLRDQTASSVHGQVGLLGDPFSVRDPTMLLITVLHHAGTDADRLLDCVEEEVDRLAAGGPTEHELATSKASLTARLARQFDSVLGRSLQMASFALRREDPGLVDRLPELIADVDCQQVLEAARGLSIQFHSTLLLRTEGSC